MKQFLRSFLVLVCLFALALPISAQATGPGKTDNGNAVAQDPFLWLEEVTGGPAMAWVRACNAASTRELAHSAGFQNLKKDIQKILNSNARIPYVTKYGNYYYNYWRDAENPRGLWRRTSLAEYRQQKPKWDVILDLDALNKAENTNWVWHGADILKAGGYRHVLINLSRGGADAAVVREFDLKTRRFVKDGFQLPEAKGA